MRAVRWYGSKDIRVENVPDPGIVNPRDAVIKVSSTAICGSDLHLYNGFIPSMKKGDILGHEFMGEVVDKGKGVTGLEIGDRVVVSAVIACGHCRYCAEGEFALCDNSNPNHKIQGRIFGSPTASIYGCSHLFGGYAGGQAEYVRIPFADTGALKVPKDIPDEKVLFLSDVFPTGFMAAEMCGIKPGQTVAIWGSGPIGLFALRSALMLGAGRVFVIDREEYRLRLARKAGAETLHLDEVRVNEALRDLTQGRGPDACIDAVGMEAHGEGLEGFFDRAQQFLHLEIDRPHVLRQMIFACRKGGTLSVVGFYGGPVDKIPMGVLMGKCLTLKAGQMHGQRYMPGLLRRILEEEIDPSFIISHRRPLEEAPECYRIFNDKKDDCVKVVLKP